MLRVHGEDKLNKTQFRQNASCDTCCYFVKQDHDMGACHRYPPQFAGEQTPIEQHRWRFPLVMPHAWCGEHRPHSSNETKA